MEQHILTFDVGTTSVKVALHNAQLACIACESVAYALQTQQDRVEVSAQVYLDAIATGIAKLPHTEQIAAIGLTTQGETLIAVDANGIPLRDAIVWLDSRAQTQAEALAEKLPAQYFYENTGLPELGGALPLAKLQWLRENEPQMYAKTHKFLLLEDYLLWVLTGKFVTEKSLLTSTGYFNITTDTYWQEALAAAGVDVEKLPNALECGTAVGTILPEIATAWALPQAIVVATGAMDQTAAALAAGCTQAGTVTETTGTALVMAAYTEAPVFATEHHVTVYRHVQKGQFLYLPIGNTAGMALQWFADEFCKDLPLHDRYTAIDSMCADVAAGCEGLLFLPYLSGSVDPLFLPQATGCFFGARLSTTRAHFARAVLESVGYQIADFLQMLAALDCHATLFIALGGGAKSAFWTQLKADICNITYHVPACTEAPSTGCAILAAWACGLLKRGQLPPLANESVFAPDAQHRAVYKRQSAAFRTLLHTLAPLYEQEDSHA